MKRNLPVWDGMVNIDDGFRRRSVVATIDDDDNLGLDLRKSYDAQSRCEAQSRVYLQANHDPGYV